MYLAELIGAVELGGIIAVALPVIGVAAIAYLWLRHGKGE